VSPVYLIFPNINTDTEQKAFQSIYKNSVIFASDIEDVWGIKYATEFHMTNDSKLFPSRMKWESGGYQSDCHGLWLNAENEVAIPLYEGRMIGQFDFSKKGWVSGKGRGAKWRWIDWSDKVIEPQFLISISDAGNPAKYLRLAFMDITRATVARTMKVAAVVQAACGKRRDDCFTVLDIWKMITTNAHATGEPGVYYIDRVNEDNPTPALGSINATNPCGEQPLLDFEACNLGSLNISKFVLPDGSDLDWEALGEATDFSVRFLDDVIDANHWPIPEIMNISLGNRKIGLGIMGFADTLVLLGIRYDSDEAVDFAKRLSGFIQDKAHQASRKLAQQRGSFPNWQDSIWNTDRQIPMRNAACTTIAPTGSISIIAKCSSGIEPIFKLAYKRRALDGAEFVQLHPLLERLGAEQGWLNEQIRAELISGADPSEIRGIPVDLGEIFVTAHEIAPEWHVRIQAAFQSNVDNAVSKTVNLPADATVDDVDRIFKLAYKLRCKGVTVYRDNSRNNQVLSAVQTLQRSIGETSGPRARPRTTIGQTSKFRMGCGTLFVTVNRDEEGICEVFANLGKAGGCPSQTEATCRAMSAALRSGVDPRVMIDQLHGIRCMSAAVAKKSNKGVDVLSCPDAIARALEEAMGSKDVAYKPPFRRTCEECGHPMRWEARCTVCDFCGHSNCG